MVCDEEEEEEEEEEDACSLEKRVKGLGYLVSATRLTLYGSVASLLLLGGSLGGPCYGRVTGMRSSWSIIITS